MLHRCQFAWFHCCWKEELTDSQNRTVGKHLCAPSWHSRVTQQYPGDLQRGTEATVQTSQRRKTTPQNSHMSCANNNIYLLEAQWSSLSYHWRVSEASPFRPIDLHTSELRRPSHAIRPTRLPSFLPRICSMQILIFKTRSFRVVSSDVEAPHHGPGKTPRP